MTSVCRYLQSLRTEQSGTVQNFIVRLRFRCRTASLEVALQPITTFVLSLAIIV